jgi:hypothetical protein
LPEFEGNYRPGRPSNNHARGFELALEAALNAASDAVNEDPNSTVAQVLLTGTEVTIVFKATVKARNPVDIDGYKAIIEVP